jgi:hypothetical protein
MSTRSTNGSRSGGIHDNGVTAIASSELAAVIRSRSRDAAGKSAENSASQTDAMTNEAAFSCTPVDVISTAAR